MTNTAAHLHPVIIYTDDQHDLALGLWRSLRKNGLKAGIFDTSIGELDATHLIVICSDTARDSLELAEAIRAFDQNHSRDNIIAIRIGGEDTELPPVLMAIEGQDRYLIPSQPQTVFDLSEHSDEAIAWLSDRIVTQLHNGHRFSGLTHLAKDFRKPVPFAALAASLLITCAAIWSFRETQKIAVQRDEAEKFSTTLLTQLTTELPGDVRSDMLLGISDEIIASFEGDDISHLDLAEIQRRAQLYHFLGEAFDARSRHDEAMEAFQQAHTLSAAMVERSPGDETAQYSHALSAFWLANSAWRAGDLETAQPHYTIFSDLIAGLAEQYPENMLYRAEQGHASINNGIVALETGREGQAVDLFQQAISFFENGAIEAGEASELDVAMANAWLADAYEQQGSIALALQARNNETSIYEHALSERPDSRSLQIRIAHSAHEQAILFGQIGDVESAANALELGLDIISPLASSDQTNLRLRRMYVSMLRERARHALWRDNLYAAQLVLDEARQAQAIWDESGADDQRHRTQANIHLIAAEIALNSGALNSALNEVLEALLAGQQGVQAGSKEAEKYIAEAHLLRGEILLSLSQSDEANTSFRNARSYYERDDVPATPYNLDALARIDWRLGNLDSARQIRSQLEAQTYQRPDFTQFWQQAQAEMSVQLISEDTNNGG